MAEILSQKEIDDLLASYGSSESGAEDVVATSTITKNEPKNYDFNHPTKFKREQLRTLQNIFESFVRGVSTFLTGYLRTSVQMEVVSSEQLRYKDVCAAFQDPMVLTCMEWPPLKGMLLMDLSNTSAFAMIDRVLGGPGFGVKHMREFTEIESILLNRINSQMVTYLREPWETIIPNIKPKMIRLETNAQFAQQLMAPTDMVAYVVMRIAVGSAEGNLNFCLPHIVLEPHMEKLSARFRFNNQHESNDNDEVNRAIMDDKLQNALIPISAILGKTNIMVSDFVNLQVGDVMILDSFEDSDLTVRIGNLDKFLAKPGMNSRGKNAFQITKQIEKED